MPDFTDLGWTLRRQQNSFDDLLAEVRKAWGDSNSTEARLRYLEPHQAIFDKMDGSLEGQMTAMNEAKRYVDASAPCQQEFIRAQQEGMEARRKANSDADAARKAESVAMDLQNAARAHLGRFR